MASVFRRLPPGSKALLTGTVGVCTATWILNSTALNSSPSRHQPSTGNKPTNQPPTALERLWTPAFISRNLVLSRTNLAEGRYHTLLTSSLTHFGGLHLACNMYGLWSFGGPFLALFGARPYVALWLTAAVVAGGTSVAVERWKAQRRRRQGSWLGGGARPEAGGIGASGCVLALVAACGTVNPMGKIVVFPLPPVRNWLFIPLFVVGSAVVDWYDFVPGIGHWAHIGGAVTGVAFGLVLRRRLRIRHF